MSRFYWWLVDVISRTLDADEREAVRGDLAESGATGRQALRDVFGLVFRRQAALWMHWKPWLTLVFLIVPLSMLLSLASKRTSDGSSVYIWMYAGNWNWDLLKNAGFWYELVHVIWIVLLEYMTLACLSWTCGFVLGSASRRMVQMNGVLLCLALLFGVLLGAPLYLAYYSRYLQHVFTLRRFAADPVAVGTFYRVFPVIVQALLVAVPSLWGMHRGAGSARPRLLPGAMLWTAAIMTLALMVIQAPGLGFFLGFPKWYWIWQSWPIRLLRIAVYWPVAYLAASALSRRWHGKTSPA